MASYFTNRGAKLLLDYGLGATTAPSTYYAILLTNNSAPTVDSNTIADCEEIVAGNGYTSGGNSYTKAQIFPDAAVQNNTSNYSTLKIEEVHFNAAGGTVPVPPNAAIRWIAITTNEATVADRQIIAVLDLGTTYTIPDGKRLLAATIAGKLAQP